MIAAEKTETPRTLDQGVRGGAPAQVRLVLRTDGR